MENLSLFDLQSGTDKKVSSAGNLDVVEMEFKEVHTLEWQELFGGFDTLHAIVYSSSIKFVYQLLEQFEYAEILFGSESIMEYSFQEIMAYQCKTVERLRDTADKLKFDLVSRIDDETLRMYVARDIFSHAKVYLLSAKDGRKRVVMGSANLSMSAFTEKTVRVSVLLMVMQRMNGICHALKI